MAVFPFRGNTTGNSRCKARPSAGLAGCRSGHRTRSIVLSSSGRGHDPTAGAQPCDDASSSHCSAAWPLAARAQQGSGVRRIGVLIPAAANDTVFQTRMAVFLQELALLGWSVGRNLSIDVRWATADAGEIRRQAAELAALAPDVILSTGDSTITPLLQATRTVPIVFPIAADPVAAGYVESLARPGGNATGFVNLEYSQSGKWLELLKELVPSIARAAVLRDATQGSGTTQFAVIQAVAPFLKMEVS